MFSFLKKKISPPTIYNLQSTSLKLSGLDCASCAVNLDLTLEELPGIISAKTNYAKSEIEVNFDEKKINIKKIKKTITDLGYL